MSEIVRLEGTPQYREVILSLLTQIGARSLKTGLLEREIAESLTEQGYRGKSGGKVRAGPIANILAAWTTQPDCPLKKELDIGKGYRYWVKALEQKEQAKNPIPKLTKIDHPDNFPFDSPLYCIFQFSDDGSRPEFLVTTDRVVWGAAIHARIQGRLDGQGWRPFRAMVIQPVKVEPSLFVHLKTGEESLGDALPRR